MKKTLKLICLALILVPTAVLNAQNVNIKLKLKKGDVYLTEMTVVSTMNQTMMGQTVDMNQNMLIAMNAEVVDELPGGNFKMKQSYSRIKMDMLINGQKMSFDTDNASEDSKLASIGKVKEAVISYEVSPKGKVTNITGFDELLGSLAGNQQAEQMLKGMANSNTLSTAYSYIPAAKVKVGDAYSVETRMPEMMNMIIETNYSVVDVSREELLLDASAEFTMIPDDPIMQNGMAMNIEAKGNQKGNFAINPKDGMVKHSEMLQNIDMEMSFKNPGTNEDVNFPMLVNTSIKINVSKK